MEQRTAPQIHRTVVSTCIASVVLALTGSLAAQAAPVRNAGPVVVATDPAGDWAAQAQGDHAEVGAATGQDLLSASLDRNGDALDFIIGVADVQLPDPARRKTLYEWHFTVDGSDDGFVLYGPCTADLLDLAFYGCTPEAVAASQPQMMLFGGPSPLIVPARIDEAKDTVTVSIPMAAIGARTGSIVTDDPSDSFEAALRVTPDENGSLSGRGVFIGDVIEASNSYRVPRS